MSKIESLEGWEFVDAADGRRWLGHVESRGEDGTVRFSKALEHVPVSSTALIVPSTAPAASVLRPTAMPQGPAMEVRHFASSPADFVPPLHLPFLPPWTVRQVGGCPCSAFPPAIQKALLAIIQGAEAASARALQGEVRAGEVRAGARRVT